MLRYGTTATSWARAPMAIVNVVVGAVVVRGKERKEANRMGCGGVSGNGEKEELWNIA